MGPDVEFLEGTVSPYQIYTSDSHISEAGSGLFVRADVPAGKEIFRVAVPTVSTVETSIDACDCCFGLAGLNDPFRISIELFTCASCKSVRYCSKRCQRSAWKRYHKEECKIYCEINAGTLRAKRLGSTSRMLIRLLILHQNGRLTDGQWQAILALKSHKALIEKSKEVDWEAFYADLKLVKKVTKDDMSEDDLQDLYWRVKFNEHSVDSPGQPQLGSCLAPSAALVNHSCDPNSYHLSEGPELVIRSFRTIAKNEEITISYIDPTQCLEERQNALFTAYAFICQCHRCEKGPEDPGEILTGDPNLDAPITLVKVQLHALLDAMMNGSKEAKIAEKELQEIFDNPSNGKPWPINVHPIPNIHIMLAKEFEQEQQWERGLHYWLKIVHVIDPLRYPERLNPHRVNNLMSLCQLEGRIFQLIDIDGTIKAKFHPIEAALSIVQYGHNIRLKEDAAASLGTNHVNFKAAAHFVELKDNQLMTAMGLTPDIWQSEPVKATQEERFKVRERELLEWVGIDPAVKIIYNKFN